MLSNSVCHKRRERANCRKVNGAKSPGNDARCCPNSRLREWMARDKPPSVVNIANDTDFRFSSDYFRQIYMFTHSDAVAIILVDMPVRESPLVKIYRSYGTYSQLTEILCQVCRHLRAQCSRDVQSFRLMFSISPTVSAKREARYFLVNSLRAILLADLKLQYTRRKKNAGYNRNDDVRKISSSDSWPGFLFFKI